MKKNHFLKKFFLGSIALTEIFSLNASAGKTPSVFSGLEMEDESENRLGAEEALKNDQQTPNSVKEILGAELQFDEFLHDPSRSDAAKRDQLMSDYRKFLSFYKDHIEEIRNLQNSPMPAEMIFAQFKADADRMLQRFLDNGDNEETGRMNREELYDRIAKEDQGSENIRFVKDVFNAIEILESKLLRLLSANDQNYHPTQKDNLYDDFDDLVFTYLLDLSGTHIWKNLKSDPDFSYPDFKKELLRIFQRYFDSDQNQPISQELNEDEMIERILSDDEAKRVWKIANGLINHISNYNFQ